MSYYEGYEQANEFMIHLDAATKAQCDPRKGWKRAGNKCVRVKQKKGKNLGGLAAAAGLATIPLTLGLAAKDRAELDKITRDFERKRGNLN